MSSKIPSALETMRASLEEPKRTESALSSASKSVGNISHASKGVSKPTKKVFYKFKIKISRTTTDGVTEYTARVFQKRTKRVGKPKRKNDAPCHHRCLDKSKCKHKCCKVLGSACAQFFGCGDLIVHLLDFLPARELFDLRQLNSRLHNTIETTPAYLQAAFYNAGPVDPTFIASMKNHMLRPKSDEEQTDQDRLLNLTKGHIMYGAPSRAVHFNAFLFNDTSIHACEYRGVDANIRLHNFTPDGAPIWADLELKFDAMAGTVNEQSSCMDMFLTQPPVKEVLVRAPLKIVYHYGHKSSWQPHSGPMLLATTGEGLRYRDLYQHLNRFNNMEGVDWVEAMPGLGGVPLCPPIKGPGLMQIPRCELIDSPREVVPWVEPEIIMQHSATQRVRRERGDRRDDYWVRPKKAKK
ncbi:unnamed protein product [Zymoseptoria tritici ST99CH_1A5]|uniref:F-box domain-containing protein n=2 Tax=Zymoseptoria tritici TaxID=1047171 RepID=A0A2H1GPR5_ZYMTR|nr:unnamed protein product [Zymoseptoria tritici ST99CH_1E4]SMY26385.1 unnamed protein product [Zymoseptoria tritici ST99CH_1A5]